MGLHCRHVPHLSRKSGRIQRNVSLAFSVISIELSSKICTTLTAPFHKFRISLAIVALMATYAISTGCVLWRRVTIPESLPPTKWSLGKWGVLVNGIGVAYAIYSFFWAFWPIYWNPTAEEV